MTNEQAIVLVLCVGGGAVIGSIGGESGWSLKKTVLVALGWWTVVQVARFLA